MNETEFRSMGTVGKAAVDERLEALRQHSIAVAHAAAALGTDYGSLWVAVAALYRVNMAMQEALERIAESYPWEAYDQYETVVPSGATTPFTKPILTNRRIARETLAVLTVASAAQEENDG